ncbi:Predicted kinase [Fructobacillus cardui]|uniref:kinase n=1 Tax=Fructobacillus cardui TaxID=2893170 RepID=UPI002DAE66DA|nr:Predicted kinase [Fructobacillus cardui]
MGNLIVIRGNSGSGKTVTANALHEQLGENNLLIPQDYVRRTMLRVKDKPKNLAINLIKEMDLFGIKNCRYTIVEGILPTSKYGQMLSEIINQAEKSFIYYYDLPFEETVKRHQGKTNPGFDEADLAKWFQPHDLLHVTGERVIAKRLGQEEVVRKIMADLNH